MCDLRNIRKIFRGTTPVQRVCVGDRVIWPKAAYTYELSDIGFAYSGGGILNVMATNFAYIYATLETKDRGVVITRETIRMTPNYRSETGHPNYYSTVNNEIRFDIDEYGKTEITGGTRSAHFYGTYEDPSHKVWTSDDFLVQLTENNKTLVIIESETAVSITTSSPVSCTTNKVTVYIHPTRKYYYQFDSGLDTSDNPQTDNSGIANLYINDTFYKEVSGTSENWKIDNVDIGYNKHTSSAKNITFKVEYYSKSGSVTLTQSGDSVYYVDENPRDWNVYLSQNTDSIGPAGGSAYYYVDAYHYVDAQGYWSSDDTPTGDPHRAERTDAVTLVSVSGASNRYSYNLNNGIFTISHTNMGIRDVSADKVTFTFANANHTSTTTSKTWNPQNTHSEARADQRGGKTYGTATTEYRNWAASISATSYSSSSSRCPASGGGTTLVWSGSHQDRTATPWTQPVYAYIRYYNYASGAPEWTERHSELDWNDSRTEYTSWTTRTDTLTPTMSAPDGGFTRSGTTVTIASEGKTTYNNGRTATFTVTNNTATQSVTIYQQYNRLEINDPETTTGFVVIQPSDVVATGATIQITGTRTYKTAYKKWTSLAEEGGETRTQTVNAGSVTIQSAPSWARVVSSSKIQVDENESTSDRRLNFQATYDGKTDTVGKTLKQLAATVEYKLTTIGLVYTGGLSYLHPSHSNYAYLTGHWERWVNGTYRDYTTVTLTPSYTSDRLKTEDTTKIYWSWENNYGITNLSQQTISGLSGSYGGKTIGTTSVIVGANRIESTTETPTAYTNVRTSPSIVPTAGLTFNTVDEWDKDAYTISGDLEYNITQTYTSTKTYTFSSTDEHRMAQSYSIPSQYSSWLSANGKRLTVSANASTSQRTATFTAYYGSVAGTVTLTQQQKMIEIEWEVVNIGNGWNKERFEDYSDIAQYTPAGEERKFALSQDGTLVIGIKITNNTSTSKTIYANQTTMGYAYNAAYSGWASWPTGDIAVTNIKWSATKSGVLSNETSYVTIPANTTYCVLFRVEGLLGYSQGTRTAWQIYTGSAEQQLTIKNNNDEKYKVRVGLKYDG